MPIPPPDSVPALETRRSRLLAELSTLGDLRPGSLVERYRKCGKAGCRCAQPDGPAHGPCWSLTRAIEGKTATWVVPSGPVLTEVQAQVAEYKRFRALEQELVEVSERLSDARIKAMEEGLTPTKRGLPSCLPGGNPAGDRSAHRRGGP